jgi:hypothetical protein
VDWEHTLDGLGLFASRDRFAAIMLPFPVKSRAMIDEIFATRDLVTPSTVRRLTAFSC